MHITHTYIYELVIEENRQVVWPSNSISNNAPWGEKTVLGLVLQVVLGPCYKDGLNMRENFLTVSTDYSLYQRR